MTHCSLRKQIRSVSSLQELLTVLRKWPPGMLVSACSQQARLVACISQQQLGVCEPCMAPCCLRMHVESASSLQELRTVLFGGVLVCRCFQAIGTQV